MSFPPTNLPVCVRFDMRSREMLRKLRRRSGQCHDCGALALPGKSRCARCLVKRALRRDLSTSRCRVVAAVALAGLAARSVLCAGLSSVGPAIAPSLVRLVCCIVRLMLSFVGSGKQSGDSG